MLLGSILYICCSDSSNQLWNFFCWHNLSRQQNLGSHVLDLVEGSFQHRVNICQHVLLCSSHFLVSHLCTPQRSSHGTDHFSCRGSLANNHGAQQTSVAVHLSDSRHRLVATASSCGSLCELALSTAVLDMTTHPEGPLQEHRGDTIPHRDSASTVASNGHIGQSSAGLSTNLATTVLGSHISRTRACFKVQQLAEFGEVGVVDPDPEQGRSAGCEVLTHKGLQLGRAVRANLVWSTVEGVAKAGSESSLMKQLNCISCGVLGGEFKFHPWKISLQLPRLECLVADHVAKIVCGQVCGVPGCLDGVESVLPSLDTGETSSCLLQVPTDPEGGVVLGSQPSGYSEGVAKPQVGVLLIPRTSLDNNTQCGHWSMVLNAGDGQATLDCGYFQWFGLHQFTLSLCHSSLGCKCPPCLDGRSLHQPRGHSATSCRSESSNKSLV